MKCDSVYILGGFQTDFARNWNKEGKHIGAMMREAFEGSLVSTRIDPADIDGVVVGNCAAELFCKQAHLGAFVVAFAPSLAGVPTVRCEAACASSGVAVLSGMANVMAGISDLVCVIGVEQMKSVDSVRCGEILGSCADYEKEADGVEFAFPKLYGTLIEEYENRYGLDDSYLARIAALNYGNARNNPNAQTRDWFMNVEHASRVDEYNPLIGSRIKAADCCQITDGAVCLYVASEEYAARYCRQRGVDIKNLPRMLGWGHTTAPIELSVKFRDSAESEYVLPTTRQAVLEAFARAGLGDCWELDVIETHDCFTITEYMAIDHFGITGPGESWKAIEEGTIESGGPLPVNPSGGLIGCGHPVGATGLRQLLDVCKQVTGSAGEYQVPGAKIGAALNIGGTGTTNVCLVVGR